MDNVTNDLVEAAMTGLGNVLVYIYVPIVKVKQLVSFHLLN
jgi:hypothetical protein